MDTKPERPQSKSWRKNLAIAGAAFSLALVSNAIMLLKSAESLPNDWRYFNSLALVVRSIILHYQTLPLHNPWICGGLDILSNPQNRIFSPFLVTDILLAPQAANLMSLLLYGTAGAVGMFTLLRRLGTSWPGSVLGSVLFLNGTWFGLHFYTGHVPYGAMQLLPFTILALQEINRPRVILATCVVHAILVLDGGIYAAAYSAMLAGTALILFPRIRKDAVHSIRHNTAVWIASICAAALIAMPKILPAMLVLTRKAPTLDFTVMNGPDVMQALFNPFMGMWDDFPTDSQYIGFHEFGCYLSLAGVTLVIARLAANREFRSKSLPWILGAGFWFWVATGWLPTINPWKIFQAIPAANYLHVQSRTFILMYFFFVILVVKAWESLGRGTLLAYGMVSILAIESILARNLVAAAPLIKREPVPARDALITSDTINHHLPYAVSPLHYLNDRNTSTSHCYEPSFQTAHIRDFEDPDYRGTVWINPAGAGTVRLNRFTPGRIEIEFETSMNDARIVFNANALYGWTLDTGAGKLDGWGTDLLTYQPEKTGKGNVVLAYRPHYALTGPGLFVIGLLIAMATGRSQVGGVRRKDDRKTAGV